MNIAHVPFDAFVNIVDAVSRQRYSGNITVHREARDLHGRRYPRIHARLSVKSSRDLGARRSPTGRRVAAPCWHAYRDILTEVFRQYPSAVVRTAMARYDGQAGFLANYPATGDRNIGYMSNYCAAAEACDCATRYPDGNDDPDTSRDNTSAVLVEADRVLALAAASTPDEWLLAQFDAGHEYVPTL
jgi:hypothetical protein